MSAKGKTDKAEKNITEDPEQETYLNYIVNFNNCTFNEKVVINQTGSPPDFPDDPPTE